MTKLKSLLNYQGGKYKQIDQINDYILKDYQNENLYDLFCGGLGFSVNFNSKFKNIICNDLITPLINLYNYFNKSEISQLLDDLNFLMNKYNLSNSNKDSCLKLRDDYNLNIHLRDKNLYFYLLICHSFSNMIRFNKTHFNQAFGKRTFNDSMKQKLIDHINLFKSKNFIFNNYNYTYYDKNVLNKNSLIYLDPPYFITGARYSELWKDDQEIELYNYIENQLMGNNFDFMLSNVICYNNNYNNYLDDFVKRNKNLKIFEIDSNYNNSNGNRLVGKTIKELLITNIG